MQQEITRFAPDGAVAAASHLAAAAGLQMLNTGGNAADAAIAAAAAMAVTSPHMCGLGGDMFCLVVTEGRQPAALNASAGPDQAPTLTGCVPRGRGDMPFSHDVRSCLLWPGAARPELDQDQDADGHQQPGGKQ